MPAIGREIQHLTKPNDRIIASHGSSCDLLYYTGRMGWTFDLEMQNHGFEKHERILRQVEKGYGDSVQWLEYLRRSGANYLVIVDKDLFKKQNVFSEYVVRHYPQVDTTQNSFLMFDLSKQIQ